MTSLDLVPILLFGALWLGAWTLDRREARGKARRTAPVAMPSFMREFEMR